MVYINTIFVQGATTLSNLLVCVDLASKEATGLVDGWVEHPDFDYRLNKATLVDGNIVIVSNPPIR